MAAILFEDLVQTLNRTQRELDRLRSLTSMSVTVGKGLWVYGEPEAISRVQKYILLDSNHPVEKEDVRRGLMRSVQKLEKENAQLEALNKIMQELLHKAGIEPPTIQEID